MVTQGMAGDGVLRSFFGCGLPFRRWFLSEFRVAAKRIIDEFTNLPVSHTNS
jgi:hypothetical protein